MTFPLQQLEILPSSTTGSSSSSGGGGAQPPPPELGAQQRRQRGRPPGIPAWNKGLPMPESTRAKISASQERTWRDAEVRRRRVEAMQGASAWNRGVPASDDARRRMSEAHTGLRHSKETRRSISKAQQGHQVRPETAALLSARLAGLAKPAEHRARIAATQRRRHAAARVLQAVEAVYVRTGEEAGAAGGSRAVAAAAAAMPPPRGAGGQPAAVAAFRAQLREYRALQEELSPWTKAFVGKHGRKPTLVDVQRTGIPWLVGKYKQYVLLRDRLFSDSSLLRSKLGPAGGAGAADAGGSASPGAGEGGGVPASAAGLGMNANGPTPAARSAAANRFAAVMQYRLQRQEAEAAQQAGASSALLGEAAAAALGADEPAASAPAQLPHSLPHLAPGVPGRVRAAMQAAQEYRAKKAAATKAAANAAAAAAQAGWHDVQLSASAAGLHHLQGSGRGVQDGAVNGHAAAVARPSKGKASGVAAPGRIARPRAAGVLPAEVAAAQAAAHRAAQEVRAAEAEVRKALQGPLQGLVPESGAGFASEPEPVGLAAVAVASS